MDESQVIDWIEVDQGGSEGGSAQIAVAEDLAAEPRVLVRGACELMPVAHYLNLVTEKVTGEYPFCRDNIQIRVEHSLFLRYALEGLSQDVFASFRALGFQSGDFSTRLYDVNDTGDVWIFGFWADASIAIYRHKTLGTRIPFNAFPAVVGINNLTTVLPEQIDENYKNHWIVPALDVLKADYEFEGAIGEELFKENLKVILGRISATAQVVIIGCNEQYIDPQGNRILLTSRVDVNQWCRDMALVYTNVSLLDLRSFVNSEDDYDKNDPNHFHRLVYFRMYEEIARRIRAGNQVAVDPLPASPSI
jgi:hypothetical protein